MKAVLLLAYIFIQTIAFGQLCNPTSSVTEVFYPNTTSTATNSGFKYLCGPNTVLYDTINTGCKYFYVNEGCTLIFKVDPACGLSSRIWLKNNSTLIVLQSSSEVQVNYEPSATIINTVGATIGLYMCSSISFPVTNCSTGLFELTNNPNLFRIWPSPTSEKINIELFNSSDLFADISIKNHLGQTVEEFNKFSIEQKEIPIDNLSNGSYIILVQTKSGRQTRKLIILR